MVRYTQEYNENAKYLNPFIREEQNLHYGIFTCVYMFLL